MNKNYYACIVTHGTLANCLKGLAEKLVVTSAPLVAYSNLELSLEEIEQNIWEDIEKQKPEKIILFVDLAGGSCWLLANRMKKRDENITIVAGVNVPLIVSYQMHVERLPWEDLLKKIIEDGKKGMILS